MSDGTWAITWPDGQRDAFTISVEVFEAMVAERNQLHAAVAACAALNCAKGPAGKHFQDPAYCGTCTSCRARTALKESP